MISSILSDYQVRKNKKQKLRFANFVQEQCDQSSLPCHIEIDKGLITNRNIVVGDVKKARIIFTAHYDTCAWMPVPNFLTPKNIFFFILYQFLLIGVIGSFGIGVACLFALFFKGVDFFSGMPFFTVANCAAFVFILQIVFGYPNKHTANDNTSGVATLLCIMQAIPVEERDKVAFVFFDNEEIGLLGSSVFKKRHQNELTNKLLINFDCVSDGDHFLVVSKKRAIHSDEYPLLKRIIEAEAPVFNKMVEFAKTTQAFFPSDQFIFPKSIGVISLKKAPIMGLYIDRIHTSSDTRFDKNNIAFLAHCFTKFVLLV